MLRVLCFLLATCVVCPPAFGQTAVQDGSWSEPATWDVNDIPFINDALDVVTIPDGILVEIPDGFGVQAELGTIRIEEGGQLYVFGSLLVTSGALDNEGILAIGPDGTVEVEESGAAYLNAGATLNYGTFAPGIWSEVRNSGSFWNFGTFDHGPRVEFENLASGVLDNGGLYSMGNFATLANRGTIVNRDEFTLWWVAVDFVNSPAVSNLAGTIVNEESGVITIEGRIFNGTFDTQTSLIENFGTIVGDDGYIANRGTGHAVIDNYGTIESSYARLESSAATQGDDNHIVNRSGGLIAGSVYVPSGSLVNQAGGTVEIPEGEILDVDPLGVVDNDSGILNSGQIDNTGIVANRCDGYIENSPGTYSGNAPLDWCDATPPAIVPSVVGTQGLSGWYVTNVAVSWSVTDPQTPIQSSTGCGPSNLNTDSSGVTYTCTATSIGGTNSESVFVKRDATRPLADFAVAPAPNGAGWHRGSVTVTFSGQDALSGLASCAAPAVLSLEGANQSASGTCADNAGNVSLTATASGINIDKTAPAIVFHDNLGTYSPADVVDIGCEVSDALSGLASSVCPTAAGRGYEFDLEAANLLEAEALDNAGNASEASTSFEVIITLASIKELAAEFIADASAVTKIGKQLDGIDAEQNAAKQEKKIVALQDYLQKLVDKGLLDAAGHDVLIMLMALQFA